jgi:hypothetical protein
MKVAIVIDREFMHNRTKQFMSRLQNRAQRLEEECEERIVDLMKRPTSKKKPVINKGPEWIDTSEVESHTKQKGAVIDFLIGKTKVKSYNQRGEKSK